MPAGERRQIRAQQRKIGRREVLHVATQKHIEGVADHEQDACVREQPTDRRQAQQIERILVHEALATVEANLAARSFPIVAANVIQLLRGQTAQALWVAAAHAHHFIDRFLQKRLLVHRGEQRMRIESEFEQRGTGSWEAYDENRAFIHRRRAGIVPGRDVRGSQPYCVMSNGGAPRAAISGALSRRYASCDRCASFNASKALS